MFIRKADGSIVQRSRRAHRAGIAAAKHTAAEYARKMEEVRLQIAASVPFDVLVSRFTKDGSTSMADRRRNFRNFLRAAGIPEPKVV